MKKLGGGSLLIAGIFLVVLGWLIQSEIVEWLLDVAGVIVIIVGVIVGLYGLVRMFTGGKGRESEY